MSLNKGKVTMQEPVAETSLSALAKAEYNAVTDRGRIYRFLIRQGSLGATDEDMQEAIPMNPNTERPRRGELVKRSLVIDSGKRRRTRYGNDAIVWVAARDPQGRLF